MRCEICDTAWYLDTAFCRSKMKKNQRLCEKCAEFANQYALERDLLFADAVTLVKFQATRAFEATWDSIGTDSFRADGRTSYKRDEVFSACLPHLTRIVPEATLYRIPYSFCSGLVKFILGMPETSRKGFRKLVLPDAVYVN